MLGGGDTPRRALTPRRFKTNNWMVPYEAAQASRHVLEAMDHPSWLVWDRASSYDTETPNLYGPR